MNGMRLYEITDALRSVIDSGYKVDEETGEILFDGSDLVGLEMALKDKCEGCALYIREQDAKIEAIRGEIDRLKDVLEREKRSQDWLKSYVLYNLKSLPDEKLKGTLATLSIRHSKAVQVLDEESVPREYMREKVTVSPDKRAIKAAIENGDDVPGCALVVNESLSVR